MYFFYSDSSEYAKFVFLKIGDGRTQAIMTMSDLKLFFCLFDRVFPKGAVFRANSGKTSGSAKYKLNILWYLPLLFFFENVLLLERNVYICVWKKRWYGEEIYLKQRSFKAILTMSVEQALATPVGLKNIRYIFYVSNFSLK